MPDQAIKAANNRRRFIVRSSLQSYILQRVRPGLTGANSHRLPQIRNEYLAVANFTRTRRFNDGFYHPVYLFVIHRQFELHLGQEIDDVFGASIEFSVTFLTAKAFDLCHGNALYPNLGQGGADIVELERFYDGDEHFHADDLRNSITGTSLAAEINGICCSTAWRIEYFYCINPWRLAPGARI